MEYRRREAILSCTIIGARLKKCEPADSGGRTGDCGGTAWVDDFLRHTGDKGVPVDFVSSHGYADDTVENLFGTNEEIAHE